MRADLQAPEFLPVLSRGRHRRNGARGGCFMEFASFLAGERWSDHPRCTHPLLAALARAVNDCTSDAGRARLTPLIPAVVGLVSADPRLDAQIALRCARTALGVVPPELARVLAVSVIASERYLAVLDGRAPDTLSAASRAALDGQPAAERWARRFIEQVGPIDHRKFAKGIGANTVRQSVLAISASPVEVDQVLGDLLAETIAESQRFVAATETPTSARRVPEWAHSG